MLRDGSIVLPQPDETGRKTVSPHERAADEELKKLLDGLNFGTDVNEIQTMQRTLADINVSDKRFTTTMVILAMSLWGLDEFGISHVLNIPTHDIEEIQRTELYSELADQLVEAIRFAETSAIHGYLAEKARLAAVTIAAELKSGDGDRRLKAAQDVLDRAGFRPADRTEHVHTFMDDLRIVHISEKETPTIDLKPEN